MNGPDNTKKMELFVIDLWGKTRFVRPSSTRGRKPVGMEGFVMEVDDSEPISSNSSSSSSSASSSSSSTYCLSTTPGKHWVMNDHGDKSKSQPSGKQPAKVSRLKESKRSNAFSKPAAKSNSKPKPKPKATNKRKNGSESEEEEVEEDNNNSDKDAKDSSTKKHKPQEKPTSSSSSSKPKAKEPIKSALKTKTASTPSPSKKPRDVVVIDDGNNSDTEPNPHRGINAILDAASLDEHENGLSYVFSVAFWSFCIVLLCVYVSANM